MIKTSKRFILLSIGAFLFAYLSGGPLPYSVFYIFLLIFLSGMLYMHIALKAVTAKVRYLKQEYSVGEKAEFTMIIENDSFIPIPYVVAINDAFTKLVDKYKGDVLFLPIDGHKKITNKVSFQNRGIYNLGRISFKISDLFCIFERMKSVENKLEIRVYPQIYSLHGISLTGSDNYENRINSQEGIEDLTLIRDIRKYRIGDNLRKVHWKLSAKHGQLYVKNFDTISGKECNIFLNMSRENFFIDQKGIAEEQMVDFCVSIIKYMLGNGVKTTLFIDSYEGKRISIENKTDFEGVMEYFLTQRSDAVGQFDQYIEANLKHISRRGWIGIISMNINEALRNSILNLTELGYKVNVFYYSESILKLENVEMLKNMGVTCLNYRELLQEVKPT